MRSVRDISRGDWATNAKVILRTSPDRLKTNYRVDVTAVECFKTIYSIICLKSVNVRIMQFAILAQSPREMALTDRILPRYFLSRVRVSIRHRICLYAKKKNSHPLTDRPGRMLQRHRPSERRNLKGSSHLHARWRLTSAADMDDFVGASKPPLSKKKLVALQRSSQARQRMRSIREEATAPGANTALTLQVPTCPTGQTLWAIIGRLTGLTASELVNLVILAS